MTASGASVAHDHKGSSFVIKTFTEIWAFGFLANSGEFSFTHYAVNLTTFFEAQQIFAKLRWQP
jgi:hypothetical protein